MSTFGAQTQARPGARETFSRRWGGGPGRLNTSRPTAASSSLALLCQSWKPVWGRQPGALRGLLCRWESPASALTPDLPRAPEAARTPREQEGGLRPAQTRPPTGRTREAQLRGPSWLQAQLWPGIAGPWSPQPGLAPTHPLHSASRGHSSFLSALSILPLARRTPRLLHPIPGTARGWGIRPKALHKPCLQEAEIAPSSWGSPKQGSGIRGPFVLPEDS